MRSSWSIQCVSRYCSAILVGLQLNYYPPMCISFTFADYVVLNRGNHEDFAICCAYGFEVEVCDKYDDVTFGEICIHLCFMLHGLCCPIVTATGSLPSHLTHALSLPLALYITGMFCELFRHLPLFAIVNNSILVLHGGLFHKNVKLSDLNEIDRSNFSLRDSTEESLTPRAEYLNLLQREALWSDPVAADFTGIGPNSRGAGVSFGYDVVDLFLAKNNLKLIVRSHECVDKGFAIPFSGK